MSGTDHRFALTALCSLAVGVSCVSGMLDDGSDSGIADGASGDGDTSCAADCEVDEVCRDGQCVLDGDRCDAVECPPGFRCHLGACIPGDPCEEVICENLSEVCVQGLCVAGEADLDGDGYQAQDDCNDQSPEIHPEATERCNGYDDDCDGEIDEGHDGDDDGYVSCGFGDPTQADCDDRDTAVYPGAAESCDGVDNNCDGVIDEGQTPRPCSTECGDGEESCDEGQWLCSAPLDCDCAPPGVIESEGCGHCGERSRSCLDDRTWSSWGACAGEGDCSAGETQSEPCGSCGTRSRSCSNGCTWSSWGGCAGEGACAPGATQAGACDRCAHQVCGPTCQWGACVLAPGSECEWQEGNHYRCCGSMRWQFCLPACVWSSACESCTWCSC